MKLIATVQLLTDEAQKERLLETLRRANAACDWIAEKAFELQTADKLRLQKLFYHEIRKTFGLSSQHAVRAISKVCEVYKRDKSKLPKFNPLGSFPYDQRLYTFKNGLDRLSILTLNGRITVPCAIGSYHRARLEGVRGQADLVYRKGKLYLFVTVDVPDGSPIDPEGWLGVDLGIRNLAVDSDAEFHSGTEVEAVRQRYSSHRQRLQACGSRSAKRRLKKISGKEARFRSIENHRISRCIVTKAKDTGRGIALENLKGIRERVTVRKSQRAKHAGWAFYQLMAFITYKALLAGVTVRLVNAVYTSQSCPECGTIDKRNRRSQSEFLCVGCGFEGHADLVGARNISSRAAVNQPIVANDDGVVSPGVRLQKFVA